ncbi:MAG: hypothetical protein HC899_29895 [Leptolyngbyaceae cyanobacterium SM1_4_3]|nr:hypothetical protein [Leptolyngbyaceae cyanobacterium SM1_4_3]
MRVSSAQETLIVTVVEVSDGVARRSGDRGGGGGEGRSVLWQRLSGWGGIGGAIQLTTPVQRIDRSRLGGAKPWATADRER